MEDLKIKEYLEEISSKKPYPGGGAVSAFGGALACSLILMAARIINQKIKENLIDKVILELLKLQEKFLKLSYLDNLAYEKVVKAYKLPKDNEEEMRLRRGEIEKALKEATLIPLDTAVLSCELLDIFLVVLEKDLKSAFSDLGVAYYLIETAFYGAMMNVKINLDSIKDQTFIKEILNKREELLRFKNKFSALREKFQSAY